MREYSTPTVLDLPITGNLTDDVVRNAIEQPHHVCLSRHTPGGWADVTASEFIDEVRRVAKGFIAAGVPEGGRVVLMSRTRYEWTLVDYAIWFAGGVTVPIYDSASTTQLKWILADSGAAAAVVETDDQAARISDIGGHSVDLEHVWTIEEGAVDSLSGLGAHVSDDELEARRTAASPPSLATIIYTSGTTGRPKGCALTHGNFMFELEAAVDDLHELFDAEDASTLLALPLAHVFARIVQVGAIKAGVRLGHTADITNLLRDLETFRPTFLLAVPKIFEKIFNRASQTAAADGKGKTFARAVRTAIAYSQSLDTGRSPLLRARHALFDRLVYTRLRDAMGGRCSYAISGGSPLGERLGHFFRGAGITVLEGYGLTETTAVVAVNLPSISKIGTVGRPLSGTNVRVADDGELLVRGPQVFGGYWNDPAGSAEVLSSESWLQTGDLGEIDHEGFVKVTGRKTEIIVTAGGKHVAPAILEDTIRAHPLVSQCLVVGDGHPFIAALVTLDQEAMRTWAEQHGRPFSPDTLSQEPDVLALIQGAVDEANAAVSQAESIRKFAILPRDWTEESGELTPSLKLRRNVVMSRFESDIRRLYDT